MVKITGKYRAQLRRKSSSCQRPFEGLMPIDVRRSCPDRQAAIQLFRFGFDIINL